MSTRLVVSFLLLSAFAASMFLILGAIENDQYSPTGSTQGPRKSIILAFSNLHGGPLYVHGGPNLGPGYVAASCFECGCSCSETANTSVANVIVHVVDLGEYNTTRLKGEVARYNPFALRILLSMESTYHRPGSKNEQVLAHFHALSSYEEKAHIPIKYGPVPSYSPDFYFNSPYKPPYTWPAYRMSTFNQNSFKTRKNAVAVFVSTCWPWRRALLEDLARHLPFDAFGACYNNKSIDKLTALKSYKYLLTVENSLCDDYVTEKLFTPLLHGAIPIYLGAPNVVDFLPDSSAIIDLRMFTSAADVANYVRGLLNDSSKAFARHHSWRNRPLSENFRQRLAESYHSRNWFCSVCKFYDHWRRQRVKSRLTRSSAMNLCWVPTVPIAWPLHPPGDI